MAAAEFSGLLAAHARRARSSGSCAMRSLLERWSERHNLVCFASRRGARGAPHRRCAGGGPASRGPRAAFSMSGAVQVCRACRCWWCGRGGAGCCSSRGRSDGHFSGPSFASSISTRCCSIAVPGPWRAPFDLITSAPLATTRRFSSGRAAGWLSRGEVVLWTTVDGAAAVEALAGWRVLSSRLPGLDRGRLTRLQPCFT